MKFILFYVPAALVFVGCTDGGYFVINHNSDSGYDDITFQNPGVFGSKFSPCLAEFTLYEDSSPPTAMWMIRSGERDCVNVDSIRLGQVPPGFTEVVPMLESRGPRTVHVTAREGGGRWGNSNSWSLDLPGN